MSQQQYVQYGSLEQYMRAVKWIVPFDEHEEGTILASRIGGQMSEEARERLVECYQSLVIGVAKRYVKHCRDMDLMDLVQEGNIGLLQAIDKFDGDKHGATFKTWAFSWIRGAILNALWQYEGAFRLPLQKVRSLRYMNTVNSKLLSLLGREPTLAETAQEMRISEDDVRELIVLQEQQVVSLHSFPGDDELLLEDIIADPTASGFADQSASAPLEEAIAKLSERERIVVNLRYGFDDGQPHTQGEIAYLLGVAVSTVSALDRHAQTHLRKALQA